MTRSEGTEDPDTAGPVRAPRATAERNVLIAFLVALVVLTVIGVVSYRSNIRLNDITSGLEHTHQALEEIQIVARGVKTIESSLRGFLLTGNEEFLIPYQRRMTRLSGDVTELGRLLASDPVQRQRWNEMRPLIDKKLAIINASMAQRKAENKVNTASLQRTLEGERLMEAILLLARNMEADARSLLTMQHTQRQHDERMTLVVIAISSGLAVVLFSLATLMIFRDLAERRRVAAELARTSTIQRAILDSANFTVISTDLNGIIRTFSAGAQRMLGYAEHEVVGKETPAIIHDGNEVVRRAAALSEELGRNIAPGFDVFVVKARQGAPDENEWSYIRKDGGRFPVRLSVTAIRDANGALVGYLGIGQDISERQKAEQSLRDSEARLRAVLDSTVDGIITIDMQGTVESINHAVERIFGYRADEVIGHNIKMLMPEPFRSAHDGYLSAYMNSGAAHIIGTSREVEGLRKNATRFPMSLAVAEVPLGDKRIFTGIVRDITESKKVERMKNEFISTVSHELRTPLTSIRGSLGLIAGGIVGAIPDKVKTLVDIACNNSERLVRLINDILDIEKINSGKMMFDIKPQALMPIVEQSLAANHAYAAQLGVHYELVEALPDAKVAVASDRIQQVLTNLLSNAAKFSPKGSAIEVSVLRRAGAVRVAVTDHGPGISVEFQSRIFDKFAQADGSDQRQKGGTGLGLSITKAIVEKHGGVVDYTTRLNEGSTFFFELPLLTTLAPLAVTVPTASTADEHARILICEDDADIAQLIAMMLIQQGYVTDIAYSAEQAKAKMLECHYSAMTLDLMLPGQDGISLVRELRASPEHRDLPIIVVSAKAEMGKVELDGGAVHMVDWLNKPIDQGRLLQAARQAVSAAGGMPTILHVEDDVDVIQVVATILAGHAELVPAQSLQVAHALLDKQRFDLVLLDVSLPDGSGLDLLPQINQLTPPPPVAIFSALDVDASVLDQVAGALVKSQTSNTLLFDTISRLVNKSMEHTSFRTAPTESDER